MNAGTQQQPEIERKSEIRPRVVIIGNLTIDDVVLPDGATRMASVGGNSLYAALGARLWQPDVGLVTRRGEDFPRDLAAELRILGLATDGIVSIPGPTVRNWVVYETNGDRHWIYRTPRQRSREVAVQPGDVPVTWLEQDPPPVVHIAAMPLQAAEAIVETVKRTAPRAVITLDTHEDYVVDYRAQLRALASQVDAFLPSRAELADLVGYDDPLRALADLARLPTAVIVVKMGAEGALVWDKARGALCQITPGRGEVVDVTGAGDAFCGGFAAGLSLGCDPVASAQRGALSAAYAVAGFSSLRLAEVAPAEAQHRFQVDPPAVRALPSPAMVTYAGTSGDAPPISGSVAAMREEIATIPQILAEQLETLATPVGTLARELCIQGIEHLYLVGCGDSGFAGAASVLAFQKHAGVQAEGVHALDLARYRVRYLPRRSAVVCISFSGKVGRTIEAAVQAKQFGHLVVAITGDPHSPLATEAASVLALSVPTTGYSPGTSTYLAMLLALLDLAVSWGEHSGHLVSAARTLLNSAPELGWRTLAAVDEPVQGLAERLTQRHWITFLGAGPNLPTAYFGAAKLLEGPARLGVATNIEEWAHEEYFVSGVETPVVLVAPSGASFDRAGEILAELNFIGADAAFVSDVHPAVVPRTFIPLAPGLPEEFSPLLTALPLSLFAFHLARASGRERFQFPSSEVAREHYETIHRYTKGEPA